MIGVRTVYPVVRLFPIWRYGYLYDGSIGWYLDPYEVREVK